MNEQTEVHALVYASRMVGSIRNADLEQILVDASLHNRMYSVTGALLFDGFCFFQYIEGPLDGLEAVFERIKLSSKHAHVDVLFTGRIAERHFWNWSMACRHAEASLIQRLEASRWTERAHSHLLDSSEENGGLRLLSDFWHSDPPTCKLNRGRVRFCQISVSVPPADAADLVVGKVDKFKAVEGAEDNG